MSQSWNRSRIRLAVLVLLIGSDHVGAAPDDVEPPPMQNQMNNQFFMNDDNFEANVFRPNGNGKQARVILETKLKLQLDEMNRVCDLNEAQMSKLKLAASSDMKRYFDAVDAIRKKYKSGKQDQEAWNRVWQEMHPLQMKMSAGLFGDTSFFAKTIRKTLSDEQYAKYKVVVTERRRYRYRASIETVITSFEDTVPLDPAQHESIVNLMLEETSLPAAFGQHDQQLVMYQLSRVPEAKLKAILNEKQWKQAQLQINSYRGMESFLIQNGLLIKEEPEAKVAKPKVKWQLIRINTPADAAEPENRSRSQPSP